MLLAQLITGSGGYAATVGGTVRVIGSNDVDVISLADIAGKISFDGSFNRGGDFIVLPNAAKTYSIVRASSSITLSDADNTITIPVGSKGATLQFSDGELVLKFDGQILIGSQAVTTTSAAITTTLSPKTALPAATSSSGTLLMALDEPVTVGGNVRVVGTNGSDTVTVADVAGNISFDGSFNRGGDKIVVGKFAENYSAARPNASNVTIGDSDTKLTIPMGSKGLSVQFSNESRTLVYSDGNAYLGNQKLSASGASVNSFENNLKFTEVLNAFVGPMPLPGKFQIITCVTAFDINGDGYKDLVINAFEKVLSSGEAPNIGNAPTLNKISILINKDGKYFENKTDQYLTGTQSLSGAPRKIEVADLNNDGKLDILYACNREDGRSGQQTEYNTAFLDVMLSSPEGYIIKTFGKEDWYHSAGFAVVDGITYAAGAGFLHGTPGRADMQGGFEFKNEKLIENLKLPFQLSPNNFIFFESPNSKDTDLLIQTAQAPNVLGVEGWQYKNGQWSKVGQIDNPGTFVKDVTVKTYNGNVQDAQIYKLDDKYIITGMGNAITESSKIDINNDGNYTVVMKMECPVVNEFDPSSNKVIDQLTEITPGDKLVFLNIENGKLSYSNINIIGKPSFIVNANTLSVFDFNGDGYDDILLSPFTKNASLCVYVNNRDGSFNYIEINPNIDINYNIDGFSISEDFNNDGIADIISMPGNGQYEVDSFNMTAFHYYTGSASVMG
jgi:hypothetical protein